MSQKININEKIAELRRLTIRQAETNDDSRLFVLNQTRAPSRGNINLTISGHGGEKQTIQAPATFIPVDLSNQLEKELVLRSPNFRRLHAAGHVAIVHPDDAEAFLQRPEVVREYQKIYGAHAITNVAPTVAIEDAQTFTAGDEATMEERALEAGISPFIVNMIGRAESGENPNDLIAELDSKLTELDITSVRFLADNTAVPQIKEWATEAQSLIGE